MNLNEILKSQGLDDAKVEAIAAAMKENKIFTAGEENLDIRYGKLKTDHEAKLTELEQANGLIAELKKASKGSEEAQKKIADYEAQVAQLQAELAKTQVDAAIKVGLLSEHALDVDYLTYKLHEKGELELDQQGNIKGWADKIAGLKTQFPAQFEAQGAKKIEQRKLPNGEGDNDAKKQPKNLAEALQDMYEQPETD